MFERRHSRWYERLLLGLPLHFAIGLPLVILLPSLERWGWEFWLYLPDLRTNTLIAVAISFSLIAFTLKRIATLPGSQIVAYIIPTVTFFFLFSIAVLFFLRESYTRQVLFTSYILSLLWFFCGYFIGRRYRRLKLAVVPYGEACLLPENAHIDWRYLSGPSLAGVRVDGVVADLRAEELNSEWEKFIAACTLSHIPVYHTRQIHESMFGRVKINRLNENDFGSLLPSSLYSGFKFVIDFCAAILLLPLLLPIMLIIAIAIKIDSRGPVIFKQPRIGYRAKEFNMYKFRSMYHMLSGEKFTVSSTDPRITRVGCFIRKYRLDELPQIFNIIKGEMSFIGPRPESKELSDWYEEVVPFFSYRHVVRPGITGWAQVEQGYAAEVEGMTVKLQYDFYYIKKFSFWIDVLIVFKTFKTLVTGFGAR
ncbi:sugar transferase [Halomonas sp. McH1-25]|uniref:sugar transferase n=1 Tax=unclassified Halomonas TaxID=2609666 RepID=UPI001EF4B64F|nr:MULTISPECIES: sugar transferase [unclassified Halomonas]MCG7598278.1 sugar transferase [Halomonas sp. McH1-25]MCP1340939.1 sugar transferase [Halomonas sp. FL8]MCP1362510.1 sugar transferase [Halomonas sp. BBD45]MCP1363981.1 sugar transferase [Halomonas sp. BBD48]